MDKKKAIKNSIIRMCDFIEFGYKQENKNGFSFSFSGDDPAGYMLIDKGVDKRIIKILSKRNISREIDVWIDIKPSPCIYPWITINVKIKGEHYGSNIIIRHGR